MDSNTIQIVLLLVAVVLFVIETIRSKSLLAAGLAFFSGAFLAAKL